MSLQWGWDNLWSWYKQIENKEYQQQILNALKIETLIKSFTPKEQYNCLEYAPDDVITSVLKHLHPATQKKLGYTVQHKNVKDYSRLVLR